MKIILASKSPRRKMLLEQLGLDFKVISSGVDESVVKEEDPSRLVTKLAELKAKTVAKAIDDEAIVIGADSLVHMDGETIGKPKDEDDARRILSLLSGKEHNVFTGFCIINTKTGKTISDFVMTKIRMRELSVADIEKCLEQKIILDGAGSYTPEIHGRIFDGVEGSYTNVVGLPTERIIPALREQGVDV